MRSKIGKKLKTASSKSRFTGTDFEKKNSAVRLVHFWNISKRIVAVYPPTTSRALHVI